MTTDYETTDPTKHLAVHEINWNEPVDDDKLRDFVKHHYEAGKLRRRRWEGNAATQLEWAAGHQTVEWNYDLADLLEVPIIKMDDLPMEARLPVSLNTIRGQVLHKIALLVVQGITWRSRPLTGKDEDRAAGRVGDKLLQWMWFNGDEPIAGTRIITALWTLFCTGVVFGKVVWDPDLGDTDVFDAGKGATDNEERRGILKATLDKLKELAGGSLRAEHVDAEGKMQLAHGQPVMRFRQGCDITEPVYARDLSQCAWLIDSELVPMETLQEEFGREKTDGIRTDEASQSLYSGYRGMYGCAPEDKGQPAEPNTLVLRHEIWRPRSRSCRAGFLGVVAGDRVLRSGTHPYNHKRLVHFRMTEIPDPRRFRPPCTVADLIGVQKARNTIRSATNAYTVLRLNPKMLAEKSTNIDADFMRDGPRVTIVDDDTVTAKKIQTIDWAPVPPEAYRLDEMYAADAQDIGGVHDATLGKRTDNKQSGKHAELMIGSDARGNSLVRIMLQESLAAGGMLSLHLWHQFVTHKRAIALTGARTDVLTFKGTDLEGSREAGKLRFNVEVEIGVEQDVTRALEEIRVLAETGFFSPENPADQARVRRLLGEHLVREGDMDSQERNSARDENNALIEGNDVGATVGDFDLQHIEEHEALTTTERYRKAVDKDPATAGRVTLHILEHRYQLAQKRVQQATIDKLVEVAEATIVQEKLAALGLLPKAPPQPTPARVPPGPGPGPNGAGRAGGGRVNAVPQGTPERSAV